MKIKIQQIDTPNLNNRTYTEQCFSKSIGKSVIGTTNGEKIDLAETSHIVHNLRIEDGFLVGDLQILDNQYGHQLQELLSEETKENFRCCGYGKVDDRGIVSDYELVSISYVNNPA